jgi:hypothetical protein
MFHTDICPAVASGNNLTVALFLLILCYILLLWHGCFLMYNELSIGTKFTQIYHMIKKHDKYLPCVSETIYVIVSAVN